MTAEATIKAVSRGWVERFSQWLTHGRISRYAITLVVVLAAVYGFNVSSPSLIDRSGHLKGTDFLQFYTAGALAASHDGAHLYDVKAHAAVALARVPAAAGVYYVPVYGPQVALLFAPLSLLSFASALMVWTVVSVAIYFWCIWTIRGSSGILRREGRLIAWLALAFPGFFAMVTYGQISAIVLAAFVLGYAALRRGDRFVAGLAFGLLAIKPQMAVLATIVFVFAGEWWILAGMAFCAAAQMGASTAYFGGEVLNEYARMLRNLPALNPILDVKPFQMHSLRAFWMMLLPGLSGWTAYVACSVVVAAVAVRIWRRAISLPLRFSALLLGTVLINPHLYVYDLVVLAPALMLIADWASRELDGRRLHAVRALLFSCFALPLLGAATQYTHLQLSVVAFAFLLFLIAKATIGQTGQLPVEPGTQASI